MGMTIEEKANQCFKGRYARGKAMTRKEKHIVCSKCGEVDFYTNFDIQKVYICFDADGENIDNRMEEVGIRDSIIPRCPYCQRKIRIVEVEE